jgi:chaperonin GroES
MTYPKAPKYRPARGHVLVRRRERSVSDGGLHIVQAQADGKSNMAKSLREGEVVLVGEARYFDNGTMIPIDAKVGDVILYSEPAGLSLDVNDPEMLLVFEGNILATRMERE